VGILRSLGRYLVHRVGRDIVDTTVGKTAQGATELSNTLFIGHAYSPYTAENAAHRAQFQSSKDASQGMER
jgi:hypothetical protein